MQQNTELKLALIPKTKKPHPNQNMLPLNMVGFFCCFFFKERGGWLLKNGFSIIILLISQEITKKKNK